MALRTFKVEIAYDGDAHVWYVRRSNVPGLHIEADTPERLKRRLPQVVADLLNSRLEIEGRDAVVNADHLAFDVIQRRSSNARLRA
ncbi:MAG TPA: DUF1902 domain-containing protein [Aestuariivirgaceae bacterium]|nr:DUF1902 domain-containing protein [Aestuariivirgaceae bacterium]